MEKEPSPQGAVVLRRFWVLRALISSSWFKFIKNKKQCQALFAIKSEKIPQYYLNRCLVIYDNVIIYKKAPLRGLREKRAL